MKAFKLALIAVISLGVFSPSIYAASEELNADGRSKIYSPNASAVEKQAKVAGFVIAARGSLTATDEAGQTRELTRRSQFYANETLKTGDGARAQLRFKDRALMTLKPNSQLNIGEYHFGGAKDPENKSFLELVSGGFRTISGAIGKTNKSAYRIQTPAASIGIRGTDYELVISLDGKVFAAVHDGGISLVNDLGELDLGADSNYFFAEVGAGQSPLGLDAMPEIFKIEGGEKKELTDEQKKKLAEKIKAGQEKVSQLLASAADSNKEEGVLESNIREYALREFANDSDFDPRLSPEQKEKLANGDFTVMVEGGKLNSTRSGKSILVDDVRYFLGDGGELIKFEETLYSNEEGPVDTGLEHVKLGYWNKALAIGILENKVIDFTDGDEGDGVYWMAADLMDVAAISEKEGQYELDVSALIGGTNVNGVEVDEASAGGTMTVNFDTNQSYGSFDFNLVDKSQVDPFEDVNLEFEFEGNIVSNGKVNTDMDSELLIAGESVEGTSSSVNGGVVKPNDGEEAPGFAAQFEAQLYLPDEGSLGVHGFVVFSDGSQFKVAPPAPFIK